MSDRTAAAHRRHVLVAEDDDAMRAMLVEALTDKGISTVAVRDGMDLIARVDHVSLVITDLRMPRLDGLSAVASLRRMQWHGPVIVLTAFSDAATRARAAELGEVQLVDKPVDPDTFADTVVRVLQTIHER